MFRRIPVSLAMAALAFAAASVTAGEPDPSHCSVHSGADRASVLNRPDGGGTPLTSCYALGGMGITAVITAVLHDSLDQPVSGYPREDMWLEAADGGLVGWPGGTMAPENSDPQGRVSWYGPLAARGSGIGTVVVIGGVPLSDQVLDIRHNSPDINADGRVDLRDLGCMTADAATGYRYRSDFFWDGKYNISDIVLMEEAYGCCGDPAPPTVQPDPHANGIGVFFDAAGTIRQATAEPGRLTVYLVASNCQTPYLVGFEADVTSDPEDGLLFMGAQGPPAYNLTQEAGEFCTAFGTPLDSSGPTVLLASLEYWVSDTRPRTFRVGPVTHLEPSIPGAACFLGGSGPDACDFDLVSFQPPAGDWNLPCAGLNGGEIQGVEERTWGAVKAVYR